jgi:uncharacterized membrane protein
MFKIKEFKKQALGQLSGHWTTPVLLTLIIGAINVLLSVPGFVSGFNTMIDELNGEFSFSYNQTEDFMFPIFTDVYRRIFLGQLVQYMFSVIAFIINGAVAIALSRFYIALSINSEKTTFTIFFDGLNRWGKGILAMLWMTLWLTLWMLLLFAIAMAVFGIGVLLLYVSVGGSEQWQEASLGVGLLIFIMGVVSIACGVFYINKSISYSQMLFLQAEYPDVSVSKSLKASIAMTKGYRKQLFLLELSFIGWSLLATISCFIGYLWLAPYLSTTRAAAYRFLKEKAFDAGLLVKASVPIQDNRGTT